MSAYIDPATALWLAHEARADDLRRAAQRRRFRAGSRSAAATSPARTRGVAAIFAGLVRHGARPVTA